MLTISEFSRLCQVSPRMLRHYDALGLLRPEVIGENGYRYYHQEQLGQLLKIQRLQKYGFRLSEVGELLSLGDEELLTRLRHRPSQGPLWRPPRRVRGVSGLDGAAPGVPHLRSRHRPLFERPGHHTPGSIGNRRSVPG